MGVVREMPLITLKRIKSVDRGGIAPIWGRNAEGYLGGARLGRFQPGGTQVQRLGYVLKVRLAFPEAPW